MELIKKIKEAEAQAKELLETARSNAASIAESSTADRNNKLEEAAIGRRGAIKAAVASAENAGKSEVEAFAKEEAEKRSVFISNARQKMDAAVNKVVSSI